MSGPMRTITCDAFNDRLMEFLEGDLDDATRAAMEAHARDCGACAALLADLRHISDEASRLPTLAASRDLWSGIASRMQAPVTEIAGRRARWNRSRLIGLAAAAAIVVAAAIGYESAHRSVPAPAAQSFPSVAAVPAAVGESAGPKPAATQHTLVAPTAAEPTHALLAANRRANATPSAVEKSYDGEIAGLRTIIKNRRGALDSTTVAVLERNLTVIDSAIVQCQRALAQDPNSQFLMQLLNQSLDTKVQILRITAALPSAT